jgi:anti-sigma factor RsiW
MVASEPLDPDMHPESTLLPWYLNGTLQQPDHQQVATHLAQCSRCRTELEELAGLRQQVREVYVSEASVPARAFQATMAQVNQRNSSATASTQHRASPMEDSTPISWLRSLDHFFRSLFQPQWVPTLAAVLIVAQLGLLYWILDRPAGPGQITTRTVAPPTARIRVLFKDAVTEQQVRSTVQEIRGRIVDGPTPDGAYVVEVPALDYTTSHTKVEALRAKSDIVRIAEPMTP